MRILRALLAAHPDGMVVGEIQNELGIAASTLSRTAVTHHLRVLREAGVLKSEKTGREVYFWPDADTVRQALDAVREYVEQQH